MLLLKKYNICCKDNWWYLTPLAMANLIRTARGIRQKINCDLHWERRNFASACM